MKNATAACIVQLLVALAVPTSARLSGWQAPKPSAAVPRTDKSFDTVDANKDGVIQRKEFVKGAKAFAPAAAPAAAPVLAPAAAPFPAPPTTPEPTTTLDPTSVTVHPEDHLKWPKGVEPGTEDTVKNVTAQRGSHDIAGVWNTENVSAWRNGKFEEGDPMNEESKRVDHAVDRALAPAPPKESEDGVATAAAKNAVHLGGRSSPDVIAAAAAGAANMTLPSVSLTFELRNVNYYMLDEPTSRSPAMGHHNVPQGNHFNLAQHRGPTNHAAPTLESSDLHHESTNGELLQRAVKDTVEQLLAIAFGQVSSMVMGPEVPRGEDHHVEIGHKVLTLAAEASAPAPAPAAMAAPAPMGATVKARGTAEAEPEHPLWSLPKIAVTMQPGRRVHEHGGRVHAHGGAGGAEESMQVAGSSADMHGAEVAPSLIARHVTRRHIRGEARAARRHRRGHHVEALTTIVKVDLVESAQKPAHSIDDARQALSMYIMDGTLASAMSAAISQAVDMQPQVGIIVETTGHISPYNVSACASHVHSLIGDFSRSYTRRQVIPALYSACTHYGQKVSFSHDHIIDRSDKKKCKIATSRFAKLWQYGRGKVDYGRFCLSLCELRHGQDSIQCDAYKHFTHKLGR